MELSASIAIARPAESVFAWLTLPEHIEQLISVEAEPLSGTPVPGTTTYSVSGPLAIGTRLTIIHAGSAALPTMQRESVLEVITYAPPTAFAVRSLSDPILMTVRCELDPQTATTRLTLTWMFAPTGAVGALAGRLGMLVTRQRLAGLMSRLKAAIEA